MTGGHQVVFNERIYPLLQNEAWLRCIVRAHIIHDPFNEETVPQRNPFEYVRAFLRVPAVSLLLPTHTHLFLLIVNMGFTTNIISLRIKKFHIRSSVRQMMGENYLLSEGFQRSENVIFIVVSDAKNQGPIHHVRVKGRNVSEVGYYGICFFLFLFYFFESTWFCWFRGCAWEPLAVHAW